MSLSDLPRILVVEDDFETQRFYEIYLSKFFIVKICDSAESFYEAVKSNKFDIILMDVSLRGLKDGIELTKEVRKDRHMKDVAIVGLSAHAFQKDIDTALDAGMDVYLTKPVENEKLLNTLIEAIERKGKSLDLEPI